MKLLSDVQWVETSGETSITVAHKEVDVGGWNTPEQAFTSQSLFVLVLIPPLLEPHWEWKTWEGKAWWL